MAHERAQIFDLEDCRLMEALADFAALAVRQQPLQAMQIEQDRSDAAVTMANGLAHRINNPLQGVTNQLFLASHADDPDRRSLADSLIHEFDRLNAVAKQLLELPNLRNRRAR